jgi:hypothetical protein
VPDRDSDNGCLTVRVPDLGGVRPAVKVVDARTLELVATAIPDRELEVPAGRYVVSSTLPSGERAVGVAEVSAGGCEEVALSALVGGSVSATVPPARGAREADGPPVPLRRIHAARPFAEATAADEVVQASAPRFESHGHGVAQDQVAALAEGAAASFFLRFLRMSGERAEVAPCSAEVTGAAEGGVVMRLRPATGPAVHFVQLARPGEVPLNVALPASSGSGSASCDLTVTAPPLGAVVTRFSNPHVDAVANYLLCGDLEQAAHVAREAEELLWGKTADPFGAALGGYALLRLRELERLHDWAQHLMDWFAWLPDGPIIAGEAAALGGDHQTAVRAFCDAGRRGLPVFADGFSLLTSRLRSYARDGGAPEIAPDLSREIGRHAARFVPMSPLVDFARVVLAFHGARLEDPLAGQEPIQPTRGVDGWRRYSPGATTIEE